MFQRLARQFGFTLLAVSLAVAPVLGAQPRCCQTGAIKGSGGCCCGPQEPEAETPSCCQAEPRPCCAQAAAEVSSCDDSAQQFSTAPCQCKSKSAPPVVATQKQGSEFSGGELLPLAITTTLSDTSRHAVVAFWNVHETAPPGRPLHKVHCRWTI